MAHLPSQIHPLAVSWFVSAGLCIFVPLLIFWIGRATHNNGQQNSYNNAQQDDHWVDGYLTCHWWEWGCNRSYNQNAQQANNNNGHTYAPWWWFFASEDEKQIRVQSNSSNPALVLVYVWSVILFCFIVKFGYRQFHNRGDLYRTTAVLAVFANFSFLAMFLIGGLDGVQTEGPEVELRGFYGQFGVMMFLTYFCWLIFSVTFALIFFARARKLGIIRIDVDETDYQIHSPELSSDVQLSDKEAV